MNRPESLADMAVSTLAAVKQMENNIDAESPERYAICLLRRAAEQAIEQGLRQAMELVHAANEVRKLNSKDAA